MALIAGAGWPEVVTVNDPAVPAVKVAAAGLVKLGAWPTMIVKVWVAAGSIPLVAVIESVLVPDAVGVPEIRALPLALGVNVRPAGRVPVSVIVGVGEPVVMMPAAPSWFSVKNAVEPLVMTGAAWALTVIDKVRVAVLPETLVAEIVTG